MQVQLADRAADCENLRGAVADALDLLGDGPSVDPGGLQRARERLAEVRDRR
jgi:hypothetical protein